MLHWWQAQEGNRRDDDKPNPRGRGTSKTPVIGAVERGGKVVAQVATDMTGRGFSTSSRTRLTPTALCLSQTNTSPIERSGPGSSMPS